MVSTMDSFSSFAVTCNGPQWERSPNKLRTRSIKFSNASSTKNKKLVNNTPTIIIKIVMGSMVQILNYITSLCTQKNNSSLKKALGDTLDLFRSLREFIGVSFAKKCYQLLLQVPEGRVTTYKE